MQCRQENLNLSFSIENILRDDFPHRQRANDVTLPTREISFERWSNTALCQYYAVHYSPVVVRGLPNMHRVEERFNGFNGEKGQILHQEQNTIEGCNQDESALQPKYGKSYFFSKLYLIT